MASLYRKERSPFWWVQFIDAAGKRHNESTKLRADDPNQTAQARSLRKTLEAAEALNVPGKQASALTGGWDFVPKFLEDFCRGKSPKTLTRYRQAWHWTGLFLAEHKVRHPRDVRFAHGQVFVDWRKAYKKRNTGSQVGHNTAVLDVKVFGMIMQRAVQLGICQANPLVRLGIGREPAESAPDIEPEEMEKIQPALAKQPEWMRLSFLVSLETGCRLRDTCLQRKHVDLERGVIHFPDPKGGKKKAFSVPLPAALAEPLRAAFADGRAVLYAMPDQPSLDWREFFDSLGLFHLRFHSLRVRYVTSLALRDVPRAVAMRLVNHGSELVHRVYQRLNVEDLRPFVSAAATRPADPGGAGAKS